MNDGKEKVLVSKDLLEELLDLLEDDRFTERHSELQDLLRCEISKNKKKKK